MTQLDAWRKRKAEILGRYGSVEAALAPCDRERALLKAVERWRVPFEANPRWTDTLDGWSGSIGGGKTPAHVLQAIREALPLPTTFAEAQLEANFWTARNAEMEDVLAEEADGGEYEGNCALDLVAEARWDMVRELVDHELPVSTLADLLARFEILRADATGNEEIEAALFRDIEAMARREAEASLAATSSAQTSVHGGQIDAALKAHPEWSNRRIARAAGCSPTTVGKVRRAIGAIAATRSVQRGGQVYEVKVKVDSRTTPSHAASTFNRGKRSSTSSERKAGVPPSSSSAPSGRSEPSAISASN